MTSSGLQAITKKSVVDATFDELRSRILRGAWEPGDKLPTEQELTRALGVSRSTVREALNRLASSNLISIQHGGSKTVLNYLEHAGLEVVPALVAGSAEGLNPQIVRSVAELRDVIAPDAARLAAHRRTDDEADALVVAAEALVSPELGLDDLTEACMVFWKALILASHNLAYRLGFNSLLVTYVTDATVLRQTISQELRAAPRYMQIAQAVKAGDAETARKATTDLVEVGSSAIFTAIDLYEETLRTEGE